ncbi:diaminopimelate decarboxylase [Candidatus Marsarchaeota G2 archaeon ECH_B_SAG-C16]|uniref:Diaminopimelate decarboxylase n=2 Tax=Candidatus Marsarchaeota group 2 TaxID=2203771 RepID=A0A2R6BGH2_9ARCH|nr:MAG: diaminopimelate decarboxylase [Candidatus Marsarchaeota G2 archaeon ECH_B_SAG-C16]
MSVSFRVGGKTSLMPPLEVGGDGSLTIGGVEIEELAERYGTPLYVTDEGRLRMNYRRLRAAFEKWYPKFRVNYAIKANSNLSVISILRQEGAGADCSNMEEITLARMAGVPSSRIIYTGNYNSDEELREALESGVTVNLDDVDLLPRLLRHGTPEMLSFRVNPGVGAGSHPGLVVGGERSKFGVEEARVIDGYRMAKEAGVRRFGLHMMTGSNVLDPEYFPAATSKLLEIGERITRTLGVEFEFIDIGGGFGVPYRPEDKPLDIERVAEAVCSTVNHHLEGGGLSGQPYLTVEPGRFLVADTTILIGKVHHVKKTSNQVFVGTDIGMNTLIRPMLYGAYHHIYVLGKNQAELTQTVNITGQICENTDMLAVNRRIPHVEAGDLIVVTTVGAYGFSMSSQYNNRPRPAEVLVKNGEAEIIRQRENVFDLIQKQHIPPRLLS